MCSGRCSCPSQLDPHWRAVSDGGLFLLIIHISNLWGKRDYGAACLICCARAPSVFALLRTHRFGGAGWRSDGAAAENTLLSSFNQQLIKMFYLQVNSFKIQMMQILVLKFCWHCRSRFPCSVQISINIRYSQMWEKVRKNPGRAPNFSVYVHMLSARHIPGVLVTLDANVMISAVTPLCRRDQHSGGIRTPQRLFYGLC